MTRLNLGCGDDIRMGFINVDLLDKPQVPQDVYRQGNVAELSWLCEEGAADEILALNVLPSVPWHQVEAVLGNWVSRLKNGGVLKMLQTDLHQVAQRIASDVLDPVAAMRLLFGEQTSPLDSHRSAIDGQWLCQILGRLGMTIEVKRYEGNGLYLEAVREGKNV